MRLANFKSYFRYGEFTSQSFFWKSDQTAFVTELSEHIYMA